MNPLKIVCLFVILGVALCLWFLGGEQFFDPKFYRDLEAESPLITLIIFFSVYVLATAFSFPGAAALTLIAGWLFGLGEGLLLVSFASSLGATLAFLLARSFFRDAVQNRFADYLAKVNEGIEKEGAFYLFTLRLIPLVPFFVINLVMGLTPMKTWTFYWVSQVGMLAGTFVYVNAGAQLANIDELSISGILTPELIASFVLIGLFPLIAKKLLAVYKKGAAS